MTRSHRQRYDRSTRQRERALRPYASEPTPQAEARLKGVVREVLEAFAGLAGRRVHVEVEAVHPVGRPLERLRAHVVLHLLEGHTEPTDDPWAILGVFDEQAQQQLDALLGETLGRDGGVWLELVTLITR